nr:TetR/AcrR family transcriptional regulator [uncultured Agathobaculum sp.]
MTNRQLAALETKKKLLAAAKRIVQEKGLSNTSIEEITKACGVSNGTFYTYFKRKEDVIFAISYDVYQEIYEKAQAYDGTFMDRLIFFMENFSGYIEKSSLKLCQEWVRNTVDPDLINDPESTSKLTQDLASVQKLMESGIERGELKKDAPVDTLSHTLVDVLYGQMLCWDMSGGAYSFAARTEEFCNTFLDAIMRPYLTELKG